MRLTAENKNVFSFATKLQTLQFNIHSSGKVPGADGSTSPWNVQGSGVGGPQRTSTSHRRHKDAVIGEVGKCQAMQELKNNQCQLEPHTLCHGQPMEFVQHWRDVVELS